jgi:hypothetical protein
MKTILMFCLFFVTSCGEEHNYVTDMRNKARSVVCTKEELALVALEFDVCS